MQIDNELIISKMPNLDKYVIIINNTVIKLITNLYRT
jgi:hypothetical protein